MTAAPRVSALRAIVDVDRLRDALHHGAGKGVRVAVIDSGVDGDHPAFAGKLAGHYEVVSGRCVSAPPTDSIGHGTATAGIILQIAPEVELSTVKVIGADSHGTAEQLITALRFAIDQKFDLINMSLGTTSDSRAADLDRLADRAFHEGRIIVAAANNFGQTAYPANFSSVIGVNLEGFEETESLRYDWGSVIELVARGVYVEAPAMGGGTQLYTGTSFACPHVTGLLARILSLYPGLSVFEARFVLSLLASTQTPH
jgi:subtilisin family serine protease